MASWSLRVKVALNFAWFGALVSLVLAIWFFYAAHDLGQRLINETLQSEMQDYQARKLRNPRSLPPSTLTLSGLVFDKSSASELIPEPLRGLSPGRHEIEFESSRYLTLVADQENERIYLLFNSDQQGEREIQYLYHLAIGVAVMTLLSALSGFWLAGRVVAPISNLVAKVNAATPDLLLPGGDPDDEGDEVDKLSSKFDRYLIRINAFMERERAFTADVSHELRTPLAIIRGALEVLDEDPGLNDAQRGKLARIDRASRDMAQLTRVLLHLAREENAVDTDCVHISMAEIVQNAVEKHHHLLQGRDVGLHVDINGTPQFKADKCLADVVVSNLLRNAIGHTESGLVHLTLNHGDLTVTDTGVGIPKTELEQVFQPYYRGGSSSGTGIGLSLVKRICQLYGWGIHIESTVGKGTMATLTFNS